MINFMVFVNSAFHSADDLFDGISKHTPDCQSFNTAFYYCSCIPSLCSTHCSTIRSVHEFYLDETHLFTYGAPTVPSSDFPTVSPSMTSTRIPSLLPSSMPSSLPSNLPSWQPHQNPTKIPWSSPSHQPTILPLTPPSCQPTVKPFVPYYTTTP